jgi:chromosome partitioning protein
VIHTTRVSEASAFKQSIIEYDAKKAEYININALMQEFELKAEALS